MTNLPGGQRRLDNAYFARMAADFAASHDDGMNMGDLKKADILIVGVSRTSKTPTSMYLAHRGYKAANYALVPGSVSQYYLDGLNLFVVGLTNDPNVSVKYADLPGGTMDETNDDYSDIDQITEEVRNARRLFNANGWPVIDVTRRSVEETQRAFYNITTLGVKSSDVKPIFSTLSTGDLVLAS